MNTIRWTKTRKKIPFLLAIIMMFLLSYGASAYVEPTTVLTVAAASDGIKKAIVDINETIDKSLNKTDQILTKQLQSLRDMLLELQNNLDAQATGLIDTADLALDYNSRHLTADADRVINDAIKAANDAMRDTGAEVRRDIRAADVSAYDLVYSLPFRKKKPRVLGVEPEELNVEANEQVVRVVGNFLQSYNRATVQGYPAVINSTSPFTFTVPEALKGFKEPQIVATVKLHSSKEFCIFKTFGCLTLPSWISKSDPDLTTTLLLRHPATYHIRAEIEVFEQSSASGAKPFRFTDGGVSREKTPYRVDSQAICLQYPQGRDFTAIKCEPGFELKNLARKEPDFLSGKGSSLDIIIDPKDRSCAVAKIFLIGAPGCPEGQFGTVGWDWQATAYPGIQRVACQGQKDGQQKLTYELEVKPSDSHTVPIPCKMTSVPLHPIWYIEVKIEEYRRGRFIRNCGILNNQVRSDRMCGHQIKHDGSGDITLVLSAN